MGSNGCGCKVVGRQVSKDSVSVWVRAASSFAPEHRPWHEVFRLFAASFLGDKIFRKPYCSAKYTLAKAWPNVLSIGNDDGRRPFPEGLLHESEPTTMSDAQIPRLSSPNALDAIARPARSQRMGELATLPVFFDLAGKRAVMAGGGAGAAWKAELLASAGASIDLYVLADEIDPEMAELLADPPHGPSGLGDITHHDRPWSTDIFTGAAIAVGDTEGLAEGQAFACAARAAGVPVNVVDKPAFCDFRFGSIVNRSPVVVGISTDGAAPILGQAIRRRIETLLPPALADWAALAARVRGAVVGRLPPGPLRRAFW